MGSREVGGMKEVEVSRKELRPMGWRFGWSNDEWQQHF